jgi:predicted nucleotidyltransferase component of viral defense system
MALGDLSRPQQRFLEHFLKDDLSEQFYLSGGTALAAFHLHHRHSEDIDLFARERFDLTTAMRLVSAIADQEPIPRRVHDRLGFVIRIEGEPLRVEFVHYAFDCIEPPVPRYGALKVDGLRDILANKLSAVIERTEPKDFADLCLLLRRPELGLTRGMADCKRKFGWSGLEYLLQAAFLRVDALRAWPELDPPLELEQARVFFREAARSLIRVDAD